VSAFVADLRHAFRLYRRTPVSSLIAVIVLAIGMTFVSAFVSLYVDLVLRPQAGFADGGRLVTLGQTDGRSLRGLSHNLINRMAEEVTALEAVTGVLSSSLVTEQGEAFVPVALVTRSFFDGLRPELHAGRGFDLTDHDVNAEPVVVISYRYWQEELDGADVIGTTLDLELRQMFSFRMDASAPAEEEEEPPPFRVVGIMAADMRGIAANETSIWLPLERAFLLAGDAPADMVESLLQTYTMASYGRLADGASVRAVVNEMRARYADRAD
jgi:hypothetical protein